MKKYLPLLFISFFIATISFIITFAINIFKSETKVEKQKRVTYEAYQQLHNKKIGNPFLVDSIAYEVKEFTYIPKKDTMILIVDLDINNLTNDARLYTSVFFKLIGGDENKMYYPNLTPFTVFANSQQKFKLIYRLPKNIIPTMWCDLHINSLTDSMQNGYVTFAKSFREGG